MTSIRTILGESLGHTFRLLFSPFSASRWLRLVFIAFFAGALGTGGCALQSLVDAPAKPGAQNQAPAVPPSAPAAAAADSAAPQQVEEYARSRYGFVDGVFRPDPSRFPAISPVWIAAVLIPLLILVLLALLALWFFAIFITVRFKFMWLRAVRDGETNIRALYGACRTEAEELFDFWITLSALEAACYLSAAGWLVGLVVSASGGWGGRIAWTPASGFRVMAPALAALLITWLLFSVVRVVGNDFLVPLTVRHPGARGIWGRWIEIYRRRRRAVWGYLALRLGLSVCWGVFQAAAAILFMLAWALAAALAFGLFALAAKFGPFLKPFTVFYSVLIGVPLFAVLLAGIGSALLPGSIFMRYFSLRMLDRIEPSGGS